MELEVLIEGGIGPTGPFVAADEEMEFAKAAIGRTQAESFPFRYICALEYVPGSATRRGPVDGIAGRPGILGTGTLVGPRAVLTAAHVVEEFAPTGSEAVSRLRIGPGRAGALLPFGSRPARRVILPSAWLADPAPGSPSDFAMVILDGPFSKDPGYWSEKRRSGDDRGSVIGALPSWRPGEFKVNHSGYPKGGSGYQTHWYSDTFELKGVVTDLLFIDSRSQRGESGSPVWITRDRSLGGRRLWAMVVSAPDPKSPAGSVREVEALIIRPNGPLERFISIHRLTST